MTEETLQKEFELLELKRWKSVRAPPERTPLRHTRPHAGSWQLLRRALPGAAARPDSKVRVMTRRYLPPCRRLASVCGS
jgi:hypothetical protein